MTDAGRKDMTDKTKETMQPDSSKSTVDKVTEGVTDTADKAARQVQPGDSKSGGQSVADTLGGTKDDAKGSTDKSMLDQAKDAVGMGQK